MIKKISNFIYKVISNNKTTSENLNNSSHSYFYKLGQPIWTERKYSNFANEAYIKNVIAHRAISLIAKCASNVEFKLYKKINNENTLIEDHEIISLLKKPNSIQSTKEFLESLYMYYQISGNVFLLLEDNIDKREMILLRPDRVQILSNNQFSIKPTGYRYTYKSNHIDYPINRKNDSSKILHIKSFHPLSDWYGLSSVEPASFSIDLHNQANFWNQSLLQNGAKPSGIITVKDPNHQINSGEFQRLKDVIYETFSNPNNAGRPMLLDGGLEWKELGFSPKDMDYQSMKEMAAREIATAFGVPSQLLGIPGDNKYNNFSEARITFWEQTILPLVDLVYNSIGKWLSENLEEEIEIKYDITSISALSEKIESMWKRIDESTFMTQNEKRNAAGL